jgi:hypothetical protein
MPPRSDSPRPAIASARDALTSTTRRSEDSLGASHPSWLVRPNRMTNMARRLPSDGSCKAYAPARLAVGPAGQRIRRLEPRGGARAARRGSRASQAPRGDDECRILAGTPLEQTQPEKNAASESRNLGCTATAASLPSSSRSRVAGLRRARSGWVMVRSLESAGPRTSLQQIALYQATPAFRLLRRSPAILAQANLALVAR